MKILVLNAGSSSQKSALYEIESGESSQLPTEPVEPLWTADITWTTIANTAELSVKTRSGALYTTQFANADRADGMQQMLQTLWSGDTQVIANAAAIDCVGHRVVHGGQTYSQAVRIDAQVKATIAALSPLAPAHNPVNLDGITLIETILGPQVPQVAVFDTAFHRHIPDAAAIYPGPYEWVDMGIRRYGFHGISHQYCADRLSTLLNRDGHPKRDSKPLKLITCHLGNGCSLAAIRDGQSLDTTMGFTPLDGLMMGSRSGSVDPGILLYLMREQGYDAAMLDDLLNHRSGLKGLSGVSHDLRSIHAAIRDGNLRAQLAWDVYIHRIRSGIGAMLMSLGGLDAVVFTAGVGEQDAAVRSAVCDGLGFLGLTIDRALNQEGRGDRDIATVDSAVRVWVVHTQEDWQIAKSCWVLAH